MILEVDGNDLEEIQDRYEAAVFQHIQIFLKDPIIPSIVVSRLQKLKNLSEAFLFFNTIVDDKKLILPELISLKPIKNWKEFWETYEWNKAKCRKEIVRTFDYYELEKLLDLLLTNELEYAEILVGFLEAVPVNENAKISESIQVIEILKECESLRDRSIIDISQESLKKISDKNVTFNLSKEVNRLRKLLKHG